MGEKKQPGNCSAISSIIVCVLGTHGSNVRNRSGYSVPMQQRQPASTTKFKAHPANQVAQPDGSRARLSHLERHNLLAHVGCNDRVVAARLDLQADA